MQAERVAMRQAREIIRGGGAEIGAALKTEFSNWRRVVEAQGLFRNSICFTLDIDACLTP